jgi:hypothetical protein
MQALAKAATTYGDADAVNKLVGSGGAHAWPGMGSGSDLSDTQTILCESDV